MSECSKTQRSDKSRTNARYLHEISLDLAMVRNELLQTLIEKLGYEIQFYCYSNIRISSKYSYVKSVSG